MVAICRVHVKGVRACAQTSPHPHVLAQVRTVYTSPVLDAWSFDNYKGYSPPATVSLSNLGIPNTQPLLVQLQFTNNARNLQVRVREQRVLAGAPSHDVLPALHRARRSRC